MQIAKALLDPPDFVRLGADAGAGTPTGRAAGACDVYPSPSAGLLRADQYLRELTPGLTDARIDQLVTYAIADADGLFIAEVGGAAVDLVRLCELHAHALYDTAVRLISESASEL